MTFTSGIFLIGLLPWFIIIYSIWGKEIRTKKLFLFFANSLFILWGGIVSFLMVIFYSVVIWIFTFMLFHNKKKLIFIISIFFALIPLVFIKYVQFVLTFFNKIVGINVYYSIVVPLGISFVTFEAISLLIDTYKNAIERCPNVIETYLYLSFFPTISSGPIMRFNEFDVGLRKSSFCIDISASIERIVFGLGKKVLIANKLSILVDYYFDGISTGNNYSSIGLWLGSIAYTLQLYFDFSGYSDIAIGVGQLLGFDIGENFNKPYQATSISMFWKRWHISLTRWFREYVYIPLGGNRCSKIRHIVNLLVVWSLTGLWHGAKWDFILWGIGHFSLLIVDKYVHINDKLKNDFIRRVYTLFFINLLWIPFRACNLKTTFRYIYEMFIGGVGIIEDRAIRFIPLIIIACLLCGSYEKLYQGFRENKGFMFLRGVVVISIAFLSICAVINSSYMPYIYGNF